MQTQLIDKKLSVLFEKYRDRDFVNNAQKEVEDIRRQALTVGGATTGAAFVINELARLSMRSRKYLAPASSLYNLKDKIWKQGINQLFLFSRLQAEGPERPLLVGRSHCCQQVLLRLQHPRAHRQPVAHPHQPCRPR